MLPEKLLGITNPMRCWVRSDEAPKMCSYRLMFEQHEREQECNSGAPAIWQMLLTHRLGKTRGYDC